MYPKGRTGDTHREREREEEEDKERTSSYKESKMKQ